MAAAGNQALKIDYRSNAKAVLAQTREFGRLIPAASAAVLVNLLLGSVERARRSSLVQGGRAAKDDSWYATPIAGADHPTAKPTAEDFRARTVKATSYVRNAKGQILSRKVERVGPQLNYLFKDKVVSRTGEFEDDLSFDMEAGVREYDLDPNVIRDNFLLESNLGGLRIVADGDGAMLLSSADDDGQKMATLEKRGIQSGKGKPRYILRRAIQGESRRWSTLMRKELAKAEKLAAQAKERLGK